MNGPLPSSALFSPLAFNAAASVFKPLCPSITSTTVFPKAPDDVAMSKIQTKAKEDCILVEEKVCKQKFNFFVNEKKNTI